MLTLYFDEYATPEFTVVGPPLAQRNAFVALLTDVMVEDFESFAQNANAPLSVFGGTAMLTNSGAGSGRVETRWMVSGVTTGRYNTTGAEAERNDGAFWDTPYDLTVTFSAAINAFGLYLTDTGDFDGVLTATLEGPGGSPVVVPINVTPGTGSGALAFFGFTDDERSYTSVKFTIVQVDPGNPGTFDRVGFDDMTIGVFPMAAPPPPPPPPPPAPDFWPGRCDPWPGGQVVL